MAGSGAEPVVPEVPTGPLLPIIPPLMGECPSFSGHHDLSHHQGDPIKLDSLTTIGRWEVEQFAYLLDRMQAVDEGGESLLDHSVVFFSSEIEDGDSHAHDNMPILLAGGGSGALSPGRHVRFDGQPSVGNLCVSILQAFGLPDTTFGDDGDAPLAGV